MTRYMNIDNLNLDYCFYASEDLSAFRHLIENLVPEKVKKGMEIMAENTPFNGYTYLIKEGLTLASFLTADGMDHIRSICGPGTLYGYRACMTGKPYNTTLSAYTTVSLYRIPKKNLLQELESNKDFEHFMNHSTLNNGLIYLKRSEFLALPNNACKVSGLLLSLAQQIGKKGSGGTVIPIPLTHDIIARIVGSNRVTVSRIMSQLMKTKCITKNFGYYAIPDNNLLKEYFLHNYQGTR